MKTLLQRMKSILLISFILGSSLLQTGCGFKDIDKRMFVLAIGIDEAENKGNQYNVILKLALPSGSLKESTGSMYTYVSKESSKVADAIRSLKNQVDKELDFGHLKTIVIGKDLLEEDISEITDIFLRRRDFQRISWVAIGKPTAEKVIKTEPTSEMPASVSLFNFFTDTAVESPYIVSTYLFDLRRRSVAQGTDPVLPIIKVDKKSTKLIVDHSVILSSGESSLELDSEQTLLYNMLRNNLKKMELKIDKDKHEYMLSIDSLNSKYKILTPDDGDPVLQVKVDLVGIIEETDQSVESNKLSELGQHGSKEIERAIHDLIVLFQEKKMDPLGIGLRYKATRLHRKDLFKQWEQEVYPNLRPDISVNIQIKSTGVIE